MYFHWNCQDKLRTLAVSRLKGRVIGRSRSSQPTNNVSCFENLSTCTIIYALIDMNISIKCFGGDFFKTMCKYFGKMKVPVSLVQME